MTQSETLFEPGAGIGLVAHPVFALVDSRNAAFAEQMWAKLELGAGPDELLDLLSSGGIRDLGDFAMASFEPSGVLRLVVRGAASASVSSVEGRVSTVEAGGARTWLETTLVGASGVRLALGDSDWADPAYRTLAGLVPAVQLVWVAAGLESGSLDEASEGLDAVLPSATVRSGTVAELPAAPRTGAPSAPRSYAEDVAGPSGRPPISKVAEPLTHALEIDPAGEPSPAPPATATQPPTEAPPDLGATQSPDHTAARLGLGSGSAGVISSVPGATIAPGNPSGLPPSQLGDHDGHTVSRAQIDALRHGIPAISEVRSDDSGPPILGRVCPAGHPNPAVAASCRLCGQSVVGDVMTVIRPPLGTLRFSSGERIVLDRSALIGRNPKVEGQFPEVPHIVRLDAGSELSRSHALVRILEWQLWLEDLGSRNGTWVTLPGRAEQRLRHGEELLLEPGAVVDLGREVTATLDIMVE